MSFATLILLGAAPARALDWATCDADPTCHVVCDAAQTTPPAGTCAFDGPAHCATGASAGDTCLMWGGVYHELVDYYDDTGSYAGVSDLVFDCAEDGPSCTIDGDWRRPSAFEVNVGWTIRNLELRNTTDFAIVKGTGSSRGVWVVEDCWIHDAHGGISGIGDDGLAARNRIEDVGAEGLVCATFTGNQLLIDNLLINPKVLGSGYPISCALTGSQVTHNTVRLAWGDAPYMDGVAAAIRAETATCNVVVGGRNGIEVTASASNNLVWGYTNSAVVGPTAVGNVIADPLFVGLEDLHPSAGSPAVDSGLCARNPGDTDQQGTVRDGNADMGALEYTPGYTPVPPRWPIREDLNDWIPSPALTQVSSPALALDDAGVPMIAWIDTQAPPDTLWFAVRNDDGSWRSEPVHETNAPIPALGQEHAVDLELDPVTGLPAVTWIGAGNTVYYAERLGDACGTDCTSIQWQGCGDPPLYDSTSSTDMGIDLEFDPISGAPAVGVLDDDGLTLWQVSGGPGAWAQTLVATPAPSQVFVDFDLDFDPFTGSADYAAIDVDPDFFTLGGIDFITDASGSFATTPIDLGTGIATFPGWSAYLAMAHGPAGELGIAFNGAFDEDQDGVVDEGIGFIERVGPVWSTPAVLVHSQFGTYDQGLDVGWATDGTPRVVAATGGIVSTAWPDPVTGEWQSTLNDVRLSAGGFLHLEVPAGTDDLLLVHQQTTPTQPIRFLATTDPGGLDPLTSWPTECDLCPGDPLKTEPGQCGCGNADTDTDLDGTADCNDLCPLDPNKIDPGVCSCGTPDTDADVDGSAACLDCNDLEPLVFPGNDADTDTIDDCDEMDGTFGYITDPLNPDTDGGGVYDGVEIFDQGTDPTNPGDDILCVDADVDGYPDIACGGTDCDDGDPNIYPGHDADADGTTDCLDGCPSDGAKTAPGTCGCSTPDTDSDSDGTPDCNDYCPNDAGKTAPGVCDCGTPDIDTDSDGTLDCLDGCPSDPAKTAAGQCGCNTPDTDSDGDTIADCVDNCPADIYKTEPGICGCGDVDVDSDSDGTYDCNDNCPVDPNKTEPGQCGCSQADDDYDGDGTANCNDSCVTDPNKTAPGVCGCGVADSDSDSDGTLDCNDGCPSDPNKTDPGVCGCGTVDLDSDSDGVYDCEDACPNDPDKTELGTCGCGVPDTDTDADGTADCDDLCPNDSDKTEPGTCGCGVHDTDTDGDGTFDCEDACPSDSNKLDPGACGCGTADTDTDADGTPDCEDTCPDDPDKTEPGDCGCGNEEGTCDGGPSGTGPDRTDKNDGSCGCSSTPGPEGLAGWAALAALLILKRRREDPPSPLSSGGPPW